MPLNHLLLHSLIPGVTSASDPGTGQEATFDKNPNETILVFQLDEANARNRLGLAGEGQKCCDHLFFYKSEQATFFLFTELKSRNIEDADQQLLSAIAAVCKSSHIQALKRNKCIRALIVTAVASPGGRREKETRRKMQAHGIEVYFGVSRGRGSACKVRTYIPELSRR